LNPLANLAAAAFFRFILLTAICAHVFVFLMGVTFFLVITFSFYTAFTKLPRLDSLRPHLGHLPNILGDVLKYPQEHP
jgi:hypothetical protein